MDLMNDLVVEAFAQLEIPVEPADGSDPQAALVVDPWGAGLPLEVKRLSLIDDGIARRLVGSHSESGSETPIRFVVADRVTAEARRVLLDAGWGYLDLRGHLAIKASRLIVSSEVDLGWLPPVRSNPLVSRAGLEVAAAILMEPETGHAVRGLARTVERSPSTVSTILSALRRDRLVDERARVIDTRLFWEVAEVWSTQREHLVMVPSPGQRTTITEPLRLGLQEVETTVGWALTDVAAAGALGAPVPVRTDQPLDVFVPDSGVLRRARTLLGAAGPAAPYACTVRVAPVPAVCRARFDVRNNYFEWPTVHPVFAALDLAQDSGRGREILQDWTPDGRWARVW